MGGGGRGGEPTPFLLTSTCCALQAILPAPASPRRLVCATAASAVPHRFPCWVVVRVERIARAEQRIRYMLGAEADHVCMMECTIVKRRRRLSQCAAWETEPPASKQAMPLGERLLSAF